MAPQKNGMWAGRATTFFHSNTISYLQNEGVAAPSSDSRWWNAECAPGWQMLWKISLGQQTAEGVFAVHHILHYPTSTSERAVWSKLVSNGSCRVKERCWHHQRMFASSPPVLAGANLFPSCNGCDELSLCPHPLKPNLSISPQQQLDTNQLPAPDHLSVEWEDKTNSPAGFQLAPGGHTVPTLM